MLNYPYPDPVALDLGAVAIHWYGLMYVAACLMGWWVARLQSKWKTNRWTVAMTDDVVMYMALGIVLGGRFGYMLFYNFGYYLSNPLAVLRVWEGGMSFHGGMLGVFFALIFFARKYKFSYFEVTDFIALCVPLGLGAGRLGNFINNELWGKIAPQDSLFGMVLFDELGQKVVRYPTQLLQLILEGIVFFVLLWVLAKRNFPRMVISGYFLILYAILRSISEFWRVPDAHIGYLYGEWLTMGHILSTPMFLLGVFLIVMAYQKPVYHLKPKLRK